MPYEEFRWVLFLEFEPTLHDFHAGPVAKQLTGGDVLKRKSGVFQHALYSIQNTFDRVSTER